MTRFLLISIFLFLSLASSVTSLQCLDPSAKFVDWYSLYKAPKVRGPSALFKNGLAHYYLDVNAPSWSLSQRSINASGTAAYNTLQQIYSSQDKDILYLMYNDEHPNSESLNGGGHTKGVVAFDGKSGFWLIHSVPKYPPYKIDGYSYPETGTIFGQSFLCITLSYDMLGLIGKQLLYNQPHIYDYQVPSSMKDDFPVLSDVLRKKKPQGPPWYNIVDIRSISGQSFTSFAKATYYGKDLYTDLVAPQLKDSLLVETWMDGGGKVATNCSGKYKIYNVMYVNLPNGVLFKETKDHSKWATAARANQNSLSGNGRSWTCIGDINHVYSQYKRGGGTVCIDNPSLWKTFRQSVEKYEQCGRN